MSWMIGKLVVNSENILPSNWAICFYPVSKIDKFFFKTVRALYMESVFRGDARSPNLPWYELSWNYSQRSQIIVNISSGTIIDCNPATQMLSGTGREALLGKPVCLLFAADEQNRAAEQLKAVWHTPRRLDCFHLVSAD